jgi:hypothetical protein
MEKKQTAVDLLVSILNKEGFAPVLTDEEIQHFKQMEKEQIVDAWNGGDYAYFYSKETGRDFADGEQYYNETFGGNNE